MSTPTPEYWVKRDGEVVCGWCGCGPADFSHHKCQLYLEGSSPGYETRRYLEERAAGVTPTISAVGEQWGSWEELLDRVDEAIDDALYKHEPVVDSECSCGARNNMDGDVLHCHRVGVVSEAVRAVLEPAGRGQ